MKHSKNVLKRPLAKKIKKLRAFNWTREIGF